MVLASWFRIVLSLPSIFRFRFSAYGVGGCRVVLKSQPGFRRDPGNDIRETVVIRPTDRDPTIPQRFYDCLCIGCLKCDYGTLGVSCLIHQANHLQDVLRSERRRDHMQSAGVTLRALRPLTEDREIACRSPIGLPRQD